MVLLKVTKLVPMLGLMGALLINFQAYSNDDASVVMKGVEKIYLTMLCPQPYHIGAEEYPYVYCIDKVELNEKKYVFKYSVFGKYEKVLRANKKSDFGSDFKEIAKKIAWEIGILQSSSGLYFSHSVIESNGFLFSTNKAEANLIKNEIRDNGIVYLIHMSSSGLVQFVYISDSAYYLHQGKSPLSLSELINKAKAQN